MNEKNFEEGKNNKKVTDLGEALQVLRKDLHGKSKD